MAEKELLKPYSWNVADSNEILDCHLINRWNVRFSTIANISPKLRHTCYIRFINVFSKVNLYLEPGVDVCIDLDYVPLKWTVKK